MTPPHMALPDGRRSYYVRTFGCKANRYDSAVLEGELARLGLVPARDLADAGVVVVNTCTVTSVADADARRIIARIRRLNTACVLVVAGCLARRDPEGVLRLGGVTAVLGTGEGTSLAAALGAEAPLPEAGQAYPVPAAYRFRGMTRGYIKIQDGCPGGCTYCIVPTVRGRSRCVPAPEVLRRLERLLEEGYREIVLTGIHLGLYSDGDGGLLSLLRRIEAIPRAFRVRLSSIECNELSRDFLRFVAGSEKVAPHLHLPLQSGSDRVLSDMRRPYTAGEYARWVETAARLIPGAGVGADAMVGFPTEAEEDFRATRDLTAALPLTYLHVFRFSPRPGTPAAAMPACSSQRIVAARARDLKALGRAKNLRFRSDLVGRVLPSIVLEKGEPTALTGNYVKVLLEEKATPNRLVQVRITGAAPHETRGRVEESDEPRDLSRV